MPKITKNSGRQSIEEFGLQGNDISEEGAQGGPPTPPPDMQTAATDLFPSEDERLEVSPIGDPLSGADLGSQAVESLDAFKFLECEPLLPGEEPEPCPVCRKNEFAYVPDYKLLDDGDVFFDGKNCTQNVVITVDSPANPTARINPDISSLNDPQFIEQQKREGIRLLLEYFNKSDVATVYYYVQKQNETARIAGKVVGGILGIASAGLLPLALEGIPSAATSAQIPTPVKGYDLESEERDVIQELLPYTDYKFHVPIQLRARTRILISVPVEFLDRVPNKLETKPTAGFQTNLEVTIKGSDFMAMTRRLRNALRVYQNKYDRWRSLDGGRLVRTIADLPSNAYTYGLPPELEVAVNLRDEKDRIEVFAQNIKDMFRQGAGFTVPDSASFRGGQFSGQNVEKITFKFEIGDDGERLLLKQVVTNKLGCPNVVFAEDSQEEFGTGDAFKKFMLSGQAQRFSSTTLFFMGALPDIDTDLQARQQKPWLEFVTKYLYPSVQVFYGTNPNTSLNEPNALQCLTGAAITEPGQNGGPDFLTDLLGSILDVGISLPDQVIENFANKTCKTREELLDEYKKISSGEDGKEYAKEFKKQLKRITQINKGVINTEDPILEILIEEIQAVMSSRKGLIEEKSSKIFDEKLKSAEGDIKKKKLKRQSKKQARKENPSNDVGIFFYNFFHRIGKCGLIDLVISAADCVAKGLGEETALGALTEAAFNAMDDVHLERIFVGLPPEKQAEIFGAVRQNFEGLPAPWDIGYIAGDYNGPGISTDAIAERKIVNERAKEIFNQSFEEGEDISYEDALEQSQNQSLNDAQSYQFLVDYYGEERAAEIYGSGDNREAIEEILRRDQNDPRPTRSANQAVLNLAGFELPPGSDLSQFGNQSPGSNGTLGRALGNVQKEIFDAYRAAMLDAVGYDELLNGLNSLPGAPVVAGLIRQLKYNPCVVKFPGLSFEPRLDSFLNTLEAEICQWDGSLTLPKLNKDGKFGENLLNLFRILGLAIYEALKEAAIALSMEILKLILDKLLSIACDSIAALGANLLDLFAGSDHFRSLLKDNMCPDATDDQLYDALKLILDAAAGPDSTCLERMTNEDMASFIDDVSLMLTQGQVIQLLSGNANEETVRLALEVAATSSSDAIRECFSNPQDLSNFFRGLSVFLPNLDELREALAPSAFDRPVHPCPDDIADTINDLRCQLLSEKGLSPEECREQIDDLKDQALQDLKDLANILQDNPFGGLPSLDSAPGCPPDGLYPAVNPLVEDLNASIASSLFERIEESHLRDLMSPLNTRGRGGVLNAIMADTRGRPFRYHNWVVGTLGSPLSSDLGLFEFYSDNAIRDPNDPPKPFADEVIGPKAIDIYGNELKALKGDFGISIGGRSYGGYPPTVGAWMAKQLKEFEPTFKTKLTPDGGGFSTPSEALEEWRRVDDINQAIIAKRQAYLEAFFVEFKFDEGGPDGLVKWPVKCAVAQSEMLRAVRDRLFIGDLDDSEEADFDTFPGYRDYSGQERAWNALTGKNISIGGNLFGKRKVNNWRDESKQILRDAGIPDNIDDFRDIDPEALKEYPDTSAADVKMSFRDFGDDPEEPERSLYSFDLNYDYNVFDENGSLKTENDFAVRLDVSYSSPSGKKLSRKQLRKRSDIQEPPSILGEQTYTYTKFEIVSKGSVDQEVLDYLDGLGIYENNVKDSLQIESMYKFFSQRFLEATSDVGFINEELDSKPEIRNYFAGNGIFDAVSSGFFQRIAKSVATGRSDLPLDDSLGEDSEPGFLSPPEVELTEEEQTRKEQKRAGQIALNTISPAFHFGYDPEVEPTIEYLDPERYGGAYARTLVKIGVDPERIPKPFYVQEQKFGGWMDLVRRMVPEVDGCEPERTPMFVLKDIAENSSKLCSNLIPDPRLRSDVLCSQETPYTKILENGPASNIDGAIRAIARIYIVDVFIRATPSFLMFAMTNENYDDLLPTYIGQRMRQGLSEDGRLFNGRNSNTYYYRVLEQCYNTISRKIDSNLLNPDTDLTAREKEAKSIIDGKIAEFEINYTGQLEMLSSAAISGQQFMKRALTPKAKEHYGGPGLGYGSAAFSKKRAQAAKRAAFDQMMADTEDQALIFLERYIREEFEAMKDVYNKNMPAFVDNVDHLFLLSDAWINGGVLGSGPFDVQSDPSSGEAHNITVGIPPTVQQRIKELEGLNLPGIDGVIESLRATFENLNSEWPFVLERYIRIEDKTEPPAEISDRPDNLYNVVNIQDWNEYVKQKKDEGLEGDISKYWGNPSLTGETTKIEEHTHTYEVDEDGNGLTSTHTDRFGNQHFHKITNGVLERAQLNPEDNGHRHEIEVTGWRFGLRLSFKLDGNNSDVFDDIMKTISEDKILSEKSYILTTPEGEKKYIIPVVSAELPIPDQEFSLFDPESYDVYCLIREMIKTTEYKTWFRYMFPLRRFVSLMAIYLSEGFFASLGSSGYPAAGGDMWEVPGGRKGSGFRRWARGDDDVFVRARKDARDVFTSMYDSAASIDLKPENNYNQKSTPNSVRSALRPRVNFEDGLRWWQRGRRLRRRPFDKDGDECGD